MYRQAFGAIVLGFLLSSPLLAETVRCNDHIVEEGMTQKQVLEYCGPPDEKNLQSDNAWIYLKGDSRLDTRMDVVIHFYANGHVREIETVDEWEADD